MVYKITVKLTCIGIFLLSACYVYPESIPQEQEKTLKLAEIKSFLQEYDPQDINANNTEELKTALLEFNNKYGSMFEDKEMLADKEKEIYKDKNAGEMRSIAFVRLFSLFEQNPEFRLDGKNQIEFLAEGLEDNDSTIRIFAVARIQDMRDTLCSENVDRWFKEAYAPYKDAVEEIYNRIKEDQRYKRFLEYLQDSKKNLTGQNNFYKAFNDFDPALKRMILWFAVMTYNMSPKPEDAFFIYNCSKEGDLWTRFYASVSLMETDEYKQKYVTEACRTFADLLEGFFKNVDANNVYFFITKLVVPPQALSDKAVLVRIFNDKDCTILKRAALLRLLRNSISTN